MDHSFVRSPDRGVMRGDSGQRGRKFESLRRIIDSSLILSDPDCIQSQIARKADCTQECHLFINTKHPDPYPLYETIYHLMIKFCQLINKLSNKRQMLLTCCQNGKFAESGHNGHTLSENLRIDRPDS